VVHCVSKTQAITVARAIADRMVEVGLQLHPDKTKIVYCKDENRRLDHEHTEFTFLGFTFRARAARRKNGTVFASFLPAISKDALNKISGEVRRWQLHHWTGHSFGEVAKRINPIVRGWIQYYGSYYRSVLIPLLQRIKRLPDAVDPQEVSTPSAVQESHEVLATNHQPVPTVVRPLGMERHPLVTKMTRAR
jgi:hypothetical protein